MRQSHLAALIVLCILIAADARAGFIGSAVVATRRFPNLSTTISTQSAVVGPALEFPSISSELWANVADSTLTLKPLITGTYGVAAFNGYVLTFTGAPTITAVSVDPSRTFLPAGLSFTANSPSGRFRFAPRQSPAGQRPLAEHNLPPGGVQSMILVDGSTISTHSTAVLQIANRLPFPWKTMAVFLLFPRRSRDFFYRAMAKRRYRIAGKMPVCSYRPRNNVGDFLLALPLDWLLAA